jgi:hypothetical protein
LLNAAQQQVFNTDPTTGQATDIVPYLAYGAPVAGSPYRAGMGPGEQAAAQSSVAAPTSLQQQAYGSAANMQVPNAIDLAQRTAATGLEGLLGLGGYRPSSFYAPDVNAPNLNQYQMQTPTAQAAQMQGPQGVGYQSVYGSQVNTPTIQAAQTGYQPNLQTFQMGPAERVQTQSITQPGNFESYMSPYMQNVVEAQQREAQRSADIAGTQRAARATQAGAFGGSRQAIENAEAARNLATQKGDIQAAGLQSAYQQAQQQFNAEQQARLQAQQANQQAGLTAGGQNLAAQLGVQQLGTQTGLQTSLANLTNQQQAAVQNQAAQLQAQGMNAQQALQAALANQQAGMQTGQFNAQQAYNTALQNAQLQQQANLANQQAGLTAGGQNLAAQLGVQQLGAGQNLQAQQLNQQAALAAQQAGEQSRQFGANLGLQGLQGALSGSAQLGNLGQQQLGAQQSITNLQNTLGQQQQTNQQAVINQAMQNLQNQRMYPQQQLQYLSSMLSGLPVSSTGQVATIPGPNMLSQLAGLGTTAAGAAGLYQNLTGQGIGSLFGFKEGGKTSSRSGIDMLAMRNAMKGA